MSLHQYVHFFNYNKIICICSIFFLSTMLKSISMVFANVSIYACLNSPHLVAYEADSRIFNTILAPFCALSAQHSRVQTPTQSMVMEDDEEPVKKMAMKIRLSS